MALSYTKTVHDTSYPAINPALPDLSTKGKVVLITGASGGIGRSIALSFAQSKPKALILLGRNSNALLETEKLIKAGPENIVVKSYRLDLCDARDVHQLFQRVATKFGGIDILVHAAGVLPSVKLLNQADTFTVLDGYKTTVVGTLAVAQAFVEVNPKPETASHAEDEILTEDENEDKNKKTQGKQTEKKPPVEKTITFINLTTAGICFPPFARMGAYVSSKMAAVKLLECFAAENEHVRLHQVHPGVIETAMSRKLEEKVQMGFPPDDISLPSDFVVWIASSQAAFLHNKLVFACWDVEQLKERKAQIVGDGSLFSGELWFGLQGFPRYFGGNPLPGVQNS